MLTEKQEHLYSLYKEVDEICRKHNIRYQLAGGTLIGAVRHRGFIPWDDDMDITMTRDNWERFVEICRTDLPEDRVLECQELNHGFHNVIARYTDKSTSAVHSTQVLFNDAAGDMIDIICYDYLPDNDKSWKQYTKDVTLYSDLINPCIVYSYRFCCNMFRYGWYRLKMRFQGKDKVLDDLQKKMFSYPKEDCPYLVLRWGGTPLIFRKEIFGESSNEIPFEDTVGEAPDFISDYIVEHYEDEWMFVPPATEQSGHNSIFSLDTDYKAIRKEISVLLDPEKEMKRFLRKKAFVMPIMAPWLLMKNSAIYIDRVKQSKYFNGIFEQKKAEIETCFAENRFDKLEDIFGEFMSVQFNKYYFGRDNYDDVYKYRHPVVIKINSGLADTLVLTLFNRNAISKAYRMITVYEQRKCVTPFMKEVKADVITFRSAVHSLSVGEQKTAYQLAEPLLKKYPHCIGIIKLMIYVFKADGFEKNRKNIARLIDQGLSLYPDDGELLKLRLDLEYKKQGANLVPEYINAFHKTINGLTRLEIQDIVTENIESCKTAEQIRAALTVVPDSADYIKKYVSALLSGGNREEAYSLFEFLREKKKALGKEYLSELKAVCGFFIGEKYSSKFAESADCESYEKLEEMQKASTGDTAEERFICGEIQRKLGLNSKAVKCYLDSAAKAKDGSNLLYLLRKRFTEELVSLRTRFDYADNLTELDVNTAEEKPASQGNINRVKLVYFCKWCEAFGSLENLSKALCRTGLMSAPADEDFSLEYMTALLDELNIPSEYVKEETDITSLTHLKLEGPQENDKNLSVYIR